MWHELHSLINEFFEGYTNLEKEEIIERINNAYHDDEIDGSQYDFLIGMIEV